ncbi:DUF2946 family protein [Azomonas macrocytogenes]|uniref:DUF2946 domain-containing protein n=1 Tax=Azomonas macrocytogenes TaxID=69962 RepID=A0A839T5C3_AZOMA|nr:DUF2946 family protein [Azomonas macrocytogenes]MBB3103125.1 hypothetical protein [Azomonas macrocytogenes]
MNPARTDRSLIAWMLYVCVLFSALACSITHGQLSGLQLNAGGGLFCSAEGHAGPGLDLDLQDDLSFKQAPGDCPFCSAFVFGAIALICLGWLRYCGDKRLRRPPCHKPRPRQAWPPANPCAP